MTYGNALTANLSSTTGLQTSNLYMDFSVADGTPFICEAFLNIEIVGRQARGAIYSEQMIDETSRVATVLQRVTGGSGVSGTINEFSRYAIVFSV